VNHLIRSNIQLASFTSWQIGGRADFFCEPETLDEIKYCYQWGLQQGYPITVIGGGSNVLVSDDGVEGLTICLRKWAKIEVQIDEVTNRLVIQATSGLRKSELLKIFLRHQLSPALFLAGLPGDVGGGIVMNAGVSESYVPQEFGEIVDWVEVLRPGGDLIRLQKKEITWSYRKAKGWEPGILIRAQLSWPYQVSPKILQMVKEANRNRLLKQPLDLPSCGSVFKNPPGQKAAELIDRAGLKGYSVGAAQVSQKHANFIVNLGGASAKDTWELILKIQDEVLSRFGVILETEVVRIGRW
jgi:UDP-N-acetylmuramate dehydrogenase